MPKEDLEDKEKSEVNAADDTELQIEVEDDTPEEDRGKEPLPKEVAADLEADELEEYDERVKQRLKQAKKVYHDERRAKEVAEREKTEAIQLAQRFFEETRQLKATLSRGEQSLVGSYVQSAELEAEKARKAYTEAYEAGDSTKLLEAQELLQIANYKLMQLHNYKPTSNPEINSVNPVQEQVVQPVRPDTKTLAWQERNQWYGTDEEMTASALGLHQKLVKEHGANYAGTDEYWQIIDTTMHRRFPEHFGEADKPSKQRTTIVAPASRSTSPKKIVLTKTQVALAKKLGLTPEQYAQEVRKLEN